MRRRQAVRLFLIEGEIPRYIPTTKARDTIPKRRFRPATRSLAVFLALKILGTTKSTGLNRNSGIGRTRPTRNAGIVSDYCFSQTLTDGSGFAVGPTFLTVVVITLPSGETMMVPLPVTTPFRLKVDAIV